MAFFDKLQEVAKTIGDKTSETMKVVGDKTSDAVEITKQKAKISSEKSAIVDVKKQIGELVWSKYSEGESVSEDIAALCATIQEHLDVIAKAEADIESVKNKTGETVETVEETAGTADESAEEAVEEKPEEVESSAETDAE
jgi:hypothetical protein